MRSWLCSLDDLSRESPSRVSWADVAKSITIILLVFWTIVGDSIYFNEMLLFLRMPLFFFVSGMFALRILTRTNLFELVSQRVGNLLYLYALWCAMLFFSIAVPLYLVRGSEIDPIGQLDIFWDVNFNMWFLYALAVATAFAWSVRKLPVLLVLAISVAAYLVSVSSGEWRYLPFIERIVRLFPFFWIALIAFPAISAGVERYYRAWPVVLGAFFLASWLVYDSPLINQGWLTFTITLVGIAGTLGFARQIAAFGWSRVLTIVGSSTLYIYVMHKIVLFYLDYGLGTLGLGESLGLALVKTVVVVAVCTILGRTLAAIPLTTWLFRAPWLPAPVPRRDHRSGTAVHAPSASR